MAAVTPVSANHCIGSNADGTPNTQLYCLKGFDDEGAPIYTCAKMRLFKVNCPKLNQLCSSLSSAYVAASVVCRQRLF